MGLGCPGPQCKIGEFEFDSSGQGNHSLMCQQCGNELEIKGVSMMLRKTECEFSPQYSPVRMLLLFITCVFSFFLKSLRII